jgi:hypothetical protein
MFRRSASTTTGTETALAFRPPSFHCCREAMARRTMPLRSRSGTSTTTTP